MRLLVKVYARRDRRIFVVERENQGAIWFLSWQEVIKCIYPADKVRVKVRIPWSQDNE